ncbi:MAG: Gfo/Idh/MocA family oxidoreductase [Planctomycetes bacterium]|nr:Gfo/Idh/MocA family oxidoreductase [Planctomycetota bacterium]
MTQPETNSAATNRRDFLKTSSLAAVGASVLGGLGSLPGAYAASDDTIKIGLIGCGGRGSEAAVQACSAPGATKLVAMGDAFDWQLNDSANKIKNALGEKPDRFAVTDDRKFVGLDAYQKVIDSGVDLVILATPPGFRPVHFEAAVKAGKHVFMEKPVAVDAPGVRQVLAAAAEAKKKNLGVGVGLQRHHEAKYIETIKRLKDGAIGKIHTARAYWNGGGVWTRDRKPGMSEFEYQVWNWYYFNWLSGDHICEQHIHNLDVINWVKDAYPVRAQGQGGRQVRVSNKAGEIYDHHFVEFEYADGSRMFSQCRHIEGCWSSVSEHVQGEKGHADISAGHIKGAEDWRFRGRGGNPYQVEHDDLQASIRAGKPINEAEFGALSSMTSILGRMCTYSGQMIEWEAALNSNISLQPKEYNFKTAPPVLPREDGSYAIAVPGLTKTV